MKKQLFSLLLMAIATMTLLPACGSDDDDNTPTMGTSYWKATDLYGRWTDPQFPDSYYVVFSAPDKIELSNGTGVHYGTFKPSTDADGRSMHVKFSDRNDNTYTWYSIEWLSTDKRSMKLDGHQYQKQ